ncbi:hypothetical protein ACFCV8_08015 [Streptomyces sp. NPDC056347]|uniref:hypothetical protein n=1 Tax=Streptomyces sp. NPDC056347 TaxID=3345790 RepID=UPI0035E0227C
MRGHLPGADRHLARALLTGPDGAAARLLAALAALAPRRPGPADAPPERAARTAVAAAARWWTAALDAGLPPGALAAAAGDFVDIALDGEVWLPPTRHSAAHTPAHPRAGGIAARTAAHPRENDALLLAAYLLTRPAPDPWHDVEVRVEAAPCSWPPGPCPPRLPCHHGKGTLHDADSPEATSAPKPTSASGKGTEPHRPIHERSFRCS